MKLIDIGLCVFVAGGVVLGGWLVADWNNNRQANAILTVTVTAQNGTIAAQDRTITLNQEAIKIQSEIIETWKEHYNRLRWQLRTSPPNQPRKGVN